MKIFVIGESLSPADKFSLPGRILSPMLKAFSSGLCGPSNRLPFERCPLTAENIKGKNAAKNRETVQVLRNFIKIVARLSLTRAFLCFSFPLQRIDHDKDIPDIGEYMLRHDSLSILSRAPVNARVLPCGEILHGAR